MAVEDLDDFDDLDESYVLIPQKLNDQSNYTFKTFDEINHSMANTLRSHVGPKTTEFHYPGMNYMGPQTNTLQRMIDGDKPVNNADKYSLFHDLEYLHDSTPHGKLKADIHAITNNPKNGFHDMIMKTGLSLRAIADFPSLLTDPNTYAQKNGLSQTQADNLYEVAKNYAALNLVPGRLIHGDNPFH